MAKAASKRDRCITTSIIGSTKYYRYITASITDISLRSNIPVALRRTSYITSSNVPVILVAIYLLRFDAALAIRHHTLALVLPTLLVVISAQCIPYIYIHYIYIYTNSYMMYGGRWICDRDVLLLFARVSRQHTLAYVSIRQHTSSYVSLRRICDRDVHLLFARVSGSVSGSVTGSGSGMLTYANVC
jgi:hypothetical protein